MKNVHVRDSERGLVLVSLYMLFPLLLILAGALVSYALAEVRAAQRSQASTQALYLAEGGIDQALIQLRSNYNWTAGYSGIPLGTTGNYSVSVQSLAGSRRRLTGQGSSTLLPASVVRSVETIVQQYIPPNFYDNVIWVSQDLDFEGNAYQVTGNIRHGDTSPSSTSHVAGSVTYDPATDPLPRLNYQQLYNIAQSQGNIYDAARIGNGHNVFPTSFWHTPPTDPNDPTTGVPNVNYITTDLVLNGNIGTIGGLFVVVGNVLTDPSATEDTTINGNGQIQGAIYTTGDFRINGGGNGLNVSGGIWTGDQARLNGHATLTYDSTYMNAIKALNINPDVQIVSWQDLS